MNGIKRNLTLATIGCAFWISAACAQQPGNAAPPTQPDAANATQTAPATTAPATIAPPPQVPAAPAKGKKNKADSSGPSALVELPPTPMLDAEGRQRLDPAGNPLFNPPVRQRRDKHGNPLFDAEGKPVMQTATELGYDEKGKKIHAQKEKTVKSVSMSITRGTLTVDGLTAKAGLNYDIKSLRYIYLYAPWIGVTVVSNSPFPGALEQKNAFSDKALTVTVEDHTLQLYSESGLLGKKPQPAFVAVDRNFRLPSKFPLMGFGETPMAPYAWPGSRENAALKDTVPAPPLPASLRPATALPPCPAGQMRSAANGSLAAQNAAPPCVTIVPAAPQKAVPAVPSPPQS